MTTVVLILLCLAIAGRELYLAFDRRRPQADRVAAAEIAVIRARLRDLETARTPDDPGPARYEEALRAADARIGSLLEQINERVLPEVNERLAEQRETTDRLAAEVALLRGRLRRQLEEAVMASLGGPADPVDVVHGLLGGEVPAPGRTGLAEAYERGAAAYGLRVELAEPGGDEPPWHIRYYLSGAHPRELERDFLELVGVLGDGADAGGLRPLLAGLHQVERGVAQIGPLLVVRTPRTLLCGVRPLAELLRPEPPAAVAGDLEAVAARLRGLPRTRLCDLSRWTPQTVGAQRA